MAIRSDLQVVLRNAEALLDRVDELLRAADDRVRANLAATDVGALVHSVCQSMSIMVRQASLCLDITAQRGLIAAVDAAQLSQAVENVISNSIKFTAPKGTIFVSVRFDGTEAVSIEIKDTGVGLSPDEQRRVFDRFYRSPTARANSVQGIGVGLSIVSSIVTSHMGHVTVNSAIGEGATVTIYVPLVPEVSSR